MKDEINTDFYCSGRCPYLAHFGCDEPLCLKCNNRHRKHPTPEQFLEEYGEEYPDDAAVYVLFETTISSEWDAELFSEARHSIAKHPSFYSNIICACTPFGKPDDKWRPE